MSKINFFSVVACYITFNIFSPVSSEVKVKAFSVQL